MRIIILFYFDYVLNFGHLFKVWFNDSFFVYFFFLYLIYRNCVRI